MDRQVQEKSKRYGYGCCHTGTQSLNGEDLVVDMPPLLRHVLVRCAQVLHEGVQTEAPTAGFAATGGIIFAAASVLESAACDVVGLDDAKNGHMFVVVAGFLAHLLGKSRALPRADKVDQAKQDRHRRNTEENSLHHQHLRILLRRGARPEDAHVEQGPRDAPCGHLVDENQRSTDFWKPHMQHSTTCQQGFSSNVGEERSNIGEERTVNEVGSHIGEERTVNEDVGHEPERGGQASAEHGYLPHVHLC